MRKILIILLLAMSIGSFNVSSNTNTNELYSNGYSNSSILNNIFPKVDEVFKYNNEFSIHITGNPLKVFKQVGELLDMAASYEY